MVSEDKHFQDYNTSWGKPVDTDIDDELKLLPKEATLTPKAEDRYKHRKIPIEPHQTVRKSKRIPYAKQTEKPKLGGVPFDTDYNKKYITIVFCRKTRTVS